jgi:hypothetical protein
MREVPGNEELDVVSGGDTHDGSPCLAPASLDTTAENAPLSVSAVTAASDVLWEGSEDFANYSFSGGVPC